MRCADAAAVDQNLITVERAWCNRTGKLPGRPGGNGRPRL